MEFTYSGYMGLITLLRDSGYGFTVYGGDVGCGKQVIIRHDVDTDAQKALELALLEHGNGVCSTYFFLLSSDFYNVLSCQTSDTVRQVAALGHDIGLHFDETRYNSGQDIKECVMREVGIMEKTLEMPIRSVSMHRPSKKP